MDLHDIFKEARSGREDGRQALIDSIRNAPDDAIMVLVIADPHYNEPARPVSLLAMANVPRPLARAVLLASIVSSSSTPDAVIEDVFDGDDCGDPSCNGHDAQRMAVIKGWVKS